MKQRTLPTMDALIQLHLLDLGLGTLMVKPGKTMNIEPSEHSFFIYVSLLVNPRKVCYTYQ